MGWNFSRESLVSAVISGEMWIEDFTDAALDTAGAEQRAAYEAAVVAHEEEEVRTVRSTVPRGVYIHRKVGEMEEME